jgi:hypothetical protein
LHAHHPTKIQNSRKIHRDSIGPFRATPGHIALVSSLPDCDYPLFCGTDKGCCGESFPYGCPSQSRCYANPPENCPGEWVQCEAPGVLIAGISPHEVKLRPGQSVNASVSFRHWGTVALQKLIVKVSGIDGEFEREITADEVGAAGGYRNSHCDAGSGCLRMPAGMLPQRQLRPLLYGNALGVLAGLFSTDG